MIQIDLVHMRLHANQWSSGKLGVCESQQEAGHCFERIKSIKKSQSRKKYLHRNTSMCIILMYLCVCTCRILLHLFPLLKLWAMLVQNEGGRGKHLMCLILSISELTQPQCHLVNTTVFWYEFLCYTV